MGTGIESRLHAMRMQDGLAKPVYRRRGEIIQSLPSICQRRPLGVGKPFSKSGLEKLRYLALQQGVDRIPDAPGELTGREFGKGDCGNFAGLVAVRQHHGNPACHERGLARPSSRFHQQYRCKIGHRSPTMFAVDESHVDASQSLPSARLAALNGSALRRR